MTEQALREKQRYVKFKGTNSQYVVLHAWVRRMLGTPNICSKCGTTSMKRYEWANISGDYKKELSDWIRLCKPCHVRMDMITAERDYCSDGHSFSGDNLGFSNRGDRICRECAKLKSRAWRLRQKAEKGKNNEQ